VKHRIPKYNVTRIFDLYTNCIHGEGREKTENMERYASE
jgi:hypothetical protein